MMPTFASIAGGRTPENIDGISILPALIGEKASGQQQEQHDYLYWEYGSGNRLRQAVRMGHWKAVKNSLSQPIELYNLEKDRAETVNIASDHPNIIKQIANILTDSREEPMPQIEPVKVKNKRYR
jgi:arylsulfatase A-like enzyme